MLRIPVERLEFHRVKACGKLSSHGEIRAPQVASIRHQHSITRPTLQLKFKSMVRLNQEAPISGIRSDDNPSNSLQNSQLFHPGIPAHLDEVMIFNGQLSNRLEILTSVVILQWFFGFKIQTHGDIIDRDCLDWKPWF